jgi:hypothetical protein
VKARLGADREKESSNDGRRNEPLTEERAALEALVETVIGAAYEVSNVLGPDFWRRSTNGRSSRNSVFAVLG